MSDEPLPPLPEFPQSKSYAFGPVEQQWVREYATAYASEAVRVAVERERAGWFRSLASAGDAQAKTEPVAWRQKMMGGEYFYTTASPAMTDWVTNGTYPVEPLYAHPPIQVEPVALPEHWQEKARQIVELSKTALDGGYEAGRQAVMLLRVLLNAHPPTSDGKEHIGDLIVNVERLVDKAHNDAIEAAMGIVLERARVNNIPGAKRGYLLRQLETTFGLIRALKQEPR